MKRIHSRGNGAGARHYGMCVANSSTATLAATGGIIDGLRCRTSVCIEDRSDNCACRPIACRYCRFPGAKNVNIGATPLHNPGSCRKQFIRKQEGDNSAEAKHGCGPVCERTEN
jgi:hypothetical protein